MKKLIHPILLLFLLLATLVGCNGADSSNIGESTTATGKDTIVGKWYNSYDYCLDVRSDGTYRLDGAYGTGTWKKLLQGYEFYDFYGAVSDVELTVEENTQYIELYGQRYYKKSSTGNSNSGIAGSTVDESFLQATTPSVGLSFSLSTDGTYYILTGIGTCTDTHIVVPEYPVEYNPTIPVKVVSTSFTDCEYVTLPASIERLEHGISSNVKAVNYLGNLDAFCSIEGLYCPTPMYGFPSVLGDISLYVNGSLLANNITIPETVTMLPDYFLYGYNKIVSATIAGDGIMIGSYAFSECDTLENVTISGSGVEIGPASFSGCDSLSSIVLSDGIRSIGSSAFQETAYSNQSSNWEMGLLYAGKYLLAAKQDITSAQIKEGTLGIGAYTFDTKRNLTVLVLPKSLKWIGQGAFRYCNALATVKYGGSETEWQNLDIGKSNQEITDSRVNFIYEWDTTPQ